MPELITSTITNTAVYTLSDGTQLAVSRSFTSGDFVIVLGLVVVCFLLVFQTTLLMVKKWYLIWLCCSRRQGLLSGWAMSFYRSPIAWGRCFLAEFEITQEIFVLLFSEAVKIGLGVYLSVCVLTAMILIAQGRPRPVGVHIVSSDE